MIYGDVLLSLMRAFPNSFINHNLEFIAHKYSNTYFALTDCETKMDVQCKVLEWLSRAAYKAQPYPADKNNKKLHRFMLDGINQFLHTDFTEDDIALIYQKLGNRVRHKLTVAFVQSGYNMDLLRGEEE